MTFVLLLALAACSEKDKPDNFEPLLHIGEAGEITRTTATVTGRIVVFGHTPFPTLAFIYGTEDGVSHASPAVMPDAEGNVSVRLSGLKAGTPYHACLQADNGRVILTSDTLGFMTLPEEIPQLHISEATGITRTEATLSGLVAKEEETPMPDLRFVYVPQDGMDPAIESAAADDEGRVSVRLKQLTAGTSYSFCLQGIHKNATLSSDTLKFTTLPDEPPTMGKSVLVSLGPASAIVSYEILGEGSEKITESGCYVSLFPSGHPQKVSASAATTGITQLHIGGLERNSTYQIQPYATNKVGETKGEPLKITTGNAVTWSEPGGLSALMGEDLYRFTTLSFAGPMNGNDLRLLRQMMGRNADGSGTNGQLAHVNLTDASIVGGGGSYDNAHYSKAHVVGQGLFANCQRLKEVTLPNSATVIEKDAFLNCSSLHRLTLPAYTEKVIPSDGCTQLAEIDISPASATYRSIDGVLFNAGASEIVWFPMGKNGDYTLPASVTSIGNYAFSHCKIKKFTLPDGLKDLGQGVFYGSAVEEANTPSTLRLIPTGTFQACPNLKTVRLGSGTELISDYAFDGCPLEHIHIEASYPPVCNPDAFSTSFAGLFSKCTLHVPTGRSDMYKADATWGQFEHIIETESR